LIPLSSGGVLGRAGTGHHQTPSVEEARMVQVSKTQAGSDSYGHVWATDGAVVEVSEDEARALVAIPDGGFAVVEPAVDETPAESPAGEPERTDVDESPPPSTRKVRAKAGDDT
jgi:hypothetical protein